MEGRIPPLFGMAASTGLVHTIFGLVTALPYAWLAKIHCYNLRKAFPVNMLCAVGRSLGQGGPGLIGITWFDFTHHKRAELSGNGGV